MTEAPFFHEVAGGPDVVARWITAPDGVRLRAAVWPGGEAGTVLLFSGRTEYVEKYARVAGDLGRRDFTVLSVDWRGQGLSDRALPDALTGHVADFADYQLDVAAVLELAEVMGLPRPYHLLAHSMGGCIGLRSMISGLAVGGATFSAPMWGIEMSPVTRPLAWSVSWIGRALGHGARYTPGTSASTYVTESPFETNLLTSDRESFEWMQRQTRVHPELSLGGPSLSWLLAALSEMRSLRASKLPNCPALAFIGADEAIVDPSAVRSVMRRWPGGRLDVVEGARHEILMERAEIRDRFLDAAVAHFSRTASSRAA